ncbi:hypothetical protein JHD50_09990 [Sulfurimonas sp. MAG313]|nr:hypothetical protein [Sulfurimonas sp. MAG313]MDF1881629.1 hypothetical protein [Sulfurimonas sp. MAG313]
MYFKSIFIIVFLLISSLSARSNYSERGIVTYKKLCKQCHGNPYKGAAMLKKKQWKVMFKDKDKKFLSVHMKNEKAMQTMQKSYYKNRRKHLMKFLISSASDSGVVPACDGNFCGN